MVCGLSLWCHSILAIIVAINANYCKNDGTKEMRVFVSEGRIYF